MTTPDFSPTTNPRKRILWKWSLAATTFVILLLAWQCGSALWQGRALANAGVRDFHQKLNGAQYEEIYRQADEGFTRAEKHDELVRFLRAVHTKLGNAIAENLGNMRVNTTIGRTFIVTQYNTSFEHGSAVETFTWRKTNGVLKLYSYDIRSDALIVN